MRDGRGGCGRGPEWPPSSTDELPAWWVPGASSEEDVQQQVSEARGSTAIRASELSGEVHRACRSSVTNKAVQW